MAAFDYLGPSPEENAQWSTARRRAALNYGQQSAQSAYARANIDKGFSTKTADLTHQWAAARNKMPGQFIRRGLQNSGIKNDAFSEYAYQRSKSFKDLGDTYQSQLFGNTLTNTQAGQNYYNSMLDVNDAENARRIALANQLKGYL